MEYKTDAVLDIQGNAIFNASVRVLTESRQLATVYNSSGVQIPNPVSTDKTGEFSMAMPNGKYYWEISVNGKVYETKGPISFFDAQEERISVKDFGAKGDGVSDDSEAVTKARISAGSNTPILFPMGVYNSSVVQPPYGGQIEGSYQHVQVGVDSAPSTDNGPLILLEKVSSSFAVDGNTAPGTAFNVLMRQVAGDVGSIAITGYSEAAGTTAGGVMGVSGRARGRTAACSLWGGWFYADMANQGGATPVRTIGTEINIKNNSGVTPTWESDVGSGSISGLVIATADSVSPGIAHAAIRVSKNTGAGFLTGIQFGVGAIQPSDASMNGEAFFLQGSSQDVSRFGGLRFGYASNNRFHYGLRTSEAVFNNNVAVWLGDNQRIRWGSVISSGPYLHYSTSATAMQFVGSSLDVAAGGSSKLLINSVQALTTRRTGWSNMTGNATRTAFNTTTATTTEIAERLKALIDDLITHGLIGN